MPVRRTLLARPVLEVAPAMLGLVLRRTTDQGTVAVRLTEVEAYDGPNDPGSHAYRGQTARNAVMFGPPGHLYVYLTYGMHFCMNISAGPDGQPSAVLLRAGEVIEGLELARARRGATPPGATANSVPSSGSASALAAGTASGRRIADRDLARGPARLCVALGIDRDANGTDLLSRTSPI